MNWIQKLGGRKFILALLSAGIAVAVDRSAGGLSNQLAGFLIALVGLFNVSNHMATKAYLASGTVDTGDVMKRLDEIKALANASSDQAPVQQLVQLLQGINDGITDVKTSNTQIGQALLRRGQ